MDNILTDYELGERIHDGRRSLVHRARRKRDGARVVVKVNQMEHPSLDELARLRREHEILVNLPIPGVVQPRELARYKSRLALVLEDTGAKDLRTLAQNQRLSVEDALAIAVELAQTLGEIHRRRVIHKDVNPSNIVVHPGTKEVQLIDFSIATRLSRESPSILQPGLLEGTLRYISPEQTGRMNRTIDYRTDFYSLGVTLYEMFTGVVPFSTDDPIELLHCHIAREPAPPREVRPDLPRQVSDIVMKLLAKTAEERYQSGRGLASDLSECLAAMRSGAPLGGFSPGRNDASGKFQIPQKLYGREAQIDALLATFERVSHGKAELLLVAGEPGIGKSALVNEVQKPLVGRRGYFIAGKFDQLERDIPYSSLIDAFQDLMRQLLGEREDRLETWRCKLEAALGANASVITEVIPAVELILGKQPEPLPLEPKEAQNRFHFVFENFVRVFAAEEHPLVIFLDDLQWADTPSLGLLQVLLTADVPHLCVYGAYRDNEVEGTHPLLATLEAIRSAGGQVTTLSLGPLEQGDVERLVADTTHCAPHRAAPLAALLYQKTRGNPFFVGQLFAALHEDGLLELDVTRREWQWDLDAIRERGFTDNVVELMVGRLQKLPVGAQRALRMAACIGNHFELGMLATVSRQKPGEAARAIWPAVEEGLLLPIGDAHRTADPVRFWDDDGEAPRASFKFLHDRVQQAAYALIEADRRSAIHLEIARLMLASTPADALDNRIFDVMNQFELGIDSLPGDEERYEVAELGLRASRRAKASAAYGPALRHVDIGLRLLPSTAFEDRHDLAFMLHVEGAEASYLNADMERAEALTSAAMDHARGPLEKVAVLETRMVLHFARNRFPEVIAIGLEALDLLGVSLPNAPQPDDFAARLQQNRELLAGRRIEDLIDLPVTTDPARIAAQRIMVNLGGPAYSANPLLWAVVACEHVNASLRYGNCRYSPVGYVSLGSIYAGMLSDVNTASAYGELAAKLVDHLPARECKSEVILLFNTFIRPWTTYFRDTVDPLRDSMQAGIEVGDVQHAAHAAAVACNMPMLTGAPLEPLIEQQARLVDFLARHKFEYLRIFGSIARQTALNLLGRSEDPRQIVGESFNEHRGRPELIETKNFTSLSLLQGYKAMLAFLFGDYEGASRAGQEHRGGLEGHPSGILQNIYGSLGSLAAYAAARPAERAALMEVVDKNQAAMAQWAKNAPMNFEHKHKLVEAERARALDQATEAMALYEQAIAGAARHGYVQEEALACERCADFCFSHGWDRAGEAHLKDAHYGYLRWGATAKVAELERRHPWLSSSRARARSAVRSAHHPDTTESSQSTLDFASLMKAARAISGEIVLDRLIQSLMQTMVESAGAQRGHLLLQQNGALRIEAEWSAELAAVIARRSAPITSEERLSTAIVNYAARTGKSVVLGDASTEGTFTRDPYVLEHRPKSVLCAPLVNKGMLIAVVYLENNLTASAFTAERLEALHLLSAQAALSIHNARLYSTMEDMVEVRTQELSVRNRQLASTLQQLENTQQQLVTQEKLASLGALTAGIAHELRNPLNFINNFSQISGELCEQIHELLDEQMARIDAKVRPELDDMLKSLQESSAAIGEHGKRANNIIEGMLLHARSGTGEREEVDLNAMLAQCVMLAGEGARGADLGFPLAIEEDYDSNVGTVGMVGQDMRRVFLNILNNALYALRQKRKAQGALFDALISIKTRRLEGRVEVRVRDNGPGIPPEIADRIYNPFFTTKPPGEGTGLGLSLSHDIVVQGHQGHMRMDTAPGEYTEFIITLPLRSANA